MRRWIRFAAFGVVLGLAGCVYPYDYGVASYGSYDYDDQPYVYYDAGLPYVYFNGGRYAYDDYYHQYYGPGYAVPAVPAYGARLRPPPPIVVGGGRGGYRGGGHWGGGFVVGRPGGAVVGGGHRGGGHGRR